MAKTRKINYNPKSRENLRQYRKNKESEQVKILKSITAEVDLEIPAEMLEVIIPTKKVFSSEEKKRFLQLLKLHLKEISGDEKVTLSDIQSVAELCKNIIMEDRLLADVQSKSKEDPTALVNVMTSIDKLKKRNKDLSESLATNRNVRVDPKAGGTISVLDLLEAYESGETASVEEKLELLKREEMEEAGPEKYRTTVEDMIR